MHKFISDEKGDMAEAAVTTPVIILLMVAIVNLGMLMYVTQILRKIWGVSNDL